MMPDYIPIHLAIIDHAWQKGMKLCIPEDTQMHSTIAVPCLTFACVVNDEERGKRWISNVGYGPMLEIIGKFCEKYQKP